MSGGRGNALSTTYQRAIHFLPYSLSLLLPYTRRLNAYQIRLPSGLLFAMVLDDCLKIYQPNLTITAYLY